MMKKTMPLMMLPEAVDRDMRLVTRELPPGVWLGRYTEYMGVSNFTLWGRGTVESRYLRYEQIPPWLCVVLDAAKLGEHFQYVTFPPPNVVLWFEVNDERELIQFVDRGKRDVS